MERPIAARMTFLEWLTLERAAYGGLLLFAGLWRVFQLGLYPLRPDEAHQALTAWEAAQGQPVTLWGLSPLLFTLQELTFIFMQAGDAAARLGPALAGLAICLIPYALRSRLGREEALIAAGFLALSPTLTYFSRYASGDVMAAMFALAALAAGLAAVEDRRWLSWVGVSLALALLSGPGAYTALLAGILCFGFWIWDFGFRASELGGRKLGIGRGWLAGGLVFLLGATAGLRHWDGVGAAAGLLGAWAARWSHPELEYPIYWPLLRLILDEPLLLVFGMYGAIVGVRQGDGLSRTLTLWAGLAVLLPTLTPGRQPEDLVIAIPPLALLAGQGATSFLHCLDFGPARLEVAAFLAVMGVLLVTLYVWVSGYSLWGTAQYVIAMLAPLGLMTGLALFYGVWVGWRVTGQAVALFGSAVGLLWTLSAGWINAHGVDLNRRPAVQWEMTSEEVRMLAGQVQRLSTQRVGDPHLLPVEIVDTPQAPVLRWYLRDIADLRIIGAPLRGEAAPVVITPFTAEWAPGEQYRGQDFLVTERWTPIGLHGRELVRWLLLRQGLTLAEQHRAILWVEESNEVLGQ
ncbi:MAG: glycosyltransferase family 39 protein [Anaerolineae bacterium]|nr:glycosyltransferase family 39 protein [Anaerolineae bacterium]MDW8098686.1 glycosyltransferase family 39 protein [Anaerolineae bacterium]